MKMVVTAWGTYYVDSRGRRWLTATEAQIADGHTPVAEQLLDSLHVRHTNEDREPPA